ncbi:hypothetical protein OBBRIDRAFT_19947 [Obba rivulosa]|uniref:Uncharacterized protein n=1 Tax=Obba rivulosa TaxID=1052685 RepID=A0A8E2DSL2_9APHY|nr:hypothetical protein OBBRIDRAFT_19947 [Obba rivulosa]
MTPDMLDDSFQQTHIYAACVQTVHIGPNWILSPSYPRRNRDGERAEHLWKIEPVGSGCDGCNVPRRLVCQRLSGFRELLCPFAYTIEQVDETLTAGADSIQLTVHEMVALWANVFLFNFSHISLRTVPCTPFCHVRVSSCIGRRHLNDSDGNNYKQPSGVFTILTS